MSDDLLTEIAFNAQKERPRYRRPNEDSKNGPVQHYVPFECGYRLYVQKRLVATLYECKHNHDGVIV